MNTKQLFLFTGLLASHSAMANSNSEIEALKAQLKQIQNKIENLEKNLEKNLAQETESKSEKPTSEINIGGAVRYQYTWSGYDNDNKDRGGDLDFNLFRLDLDGKVGDFILSAQYRWYDYMDVVHHAWLGYQPTDNQIVKLGIQEVPFGNFPASANSFFYSTAFFVGIQADFDTGLNWTYEDNDYRFDIGYYFNDELGGVDGWVEDRKDRYSSDVLGIRLNSEGISDKPQAQLGESDTLNLRMSKHIQLTKQLHIEPGISYQFGDLSQDGKWIEIEGLGQDHTIVGGHSSWAAHMSADWQQLNIRLQYAGYEYQIDNMDIDQFAIGSYNYYSSIPASADAWLVNLAWTQELNWGSISKIRYFNDYSRLINKSGGLKDTWMNSTGLIVSAGPLYTYIEYFIAQNQPFIGGNLVGNSDSTEERFNVNLGFYF